jgi:hypothetical protein
MLLQAGEMLKNVEAPRASPGLTMHYTEGY